MAKRKAPHHRGSHQRRAKAITDAAYGNPATRCWRCNRTLAEHPNTKTGRPPRWQAGHIVNGQVDGLMLPEVNTCNASHGATYGNLKRQGITPHPDQRTRTGLTW